MSNRVTITYLNRATRGLRRDGGNFSEPIRRSANLKRSRQSACGAERPGLARWP
jgi:hypothetical protein